MKRVAVTIAAGKDVAMLTNPVHTFVMPPVPAPVAPGFGEAWPCATTKTARLPIAPPGCTLLRPAIGFIREHRPRSAQFSRSVKPHIGHN